MCAQTRPRFILSSERVLGEWSQNPVNSKGKIPSSEKISSGEDGTHDAASSRTASPTHYQRAIAAPRCLKQDSEPNTLPTSYRGPTLSETG